jgi:multiple sugar transport system substrate-binding protein
MSSKEIFDKWFTSQQGYTAGATKMWEDNPVWNVDPILAPFKKIPVTGRMVGYAGAPNQKAAEVRTKYIIVDMYAKAIQGMMPEESVKWAHDELVKIYT